MIVYTKERRYEKGCHTMPKCSNSHPVIAYNPGEFYTEHYDNKAGGIVTRAATIVCYLSNCPAGGATYFPKSTGQKSMLEESSVDSLFS
eukprot:scaffold305848_cov18-Tisochrysis_lutea.AAC.1